MHVDICESSDAAAMRRFRSALKSMSAELYDWDDSAMGVELYKFRIGEDLVSVFVDDWSCDIEGPAGIVQAVLSEFRRNTP